MHFRNLCSEFGAWQYRDLWLKLKQAFKNILTRPKTFKKRVMCYSVHFFIKRKFKDLQSDSNLANNKYFPHRLGYF